MGTRGRIEETSSSCRDFQRLKLSSRWQYHDCHMVTMNQTALQEGFNLNQLVLNICQKDAGKNPKICVGGVSLRFPICKTGHYNCSCVTQIAGEEIRSLENCLLSIMHAHKHTHIYAHTHHFVTSCLNPFVLLFDAFTVRLPIATVQARGKSYLVNSVAFI